MGLAILVARGLTSQIYYCTEIMLIAFQADYRGILSGGWKDDKRDAFTLEGRTAKENEVLII